MTAPFVRTVLGDIAPPELGVTYSHEHVFIGPSRAVDRFPHLLLDDVDAMVRELAGPVALGLRAVVDGMPVDAGRDVLALADISRRARIHVVAPTGLHHDRYYGPDHWSERIGVDELAELFVADIMDGIDADDHAGPTVRRTGHRAGVIKIAGSEGGPSPRDARVFEAAAIAHARTGAPILTHCEHGTGGLGQVALLERHGVASAHVVLSHTDKVVDPGYHRELLATGATLEYDGSFRGDDAPGPTLSLIEAMVADGLGGQLVLGHDAARRTYLSVYGGRPGLSWLLGEFSARMRDRGIPGPTIEGFFVANPARAFAFATTAEGPAA
ncbi:MAG: phosphotriesterase [Candidatus Limnocylindria bacterium]